MSKERLKNRVLQAIDTRASEIIEIAETIWKNPELGFKEFQTAELVESKFEDMGWTYNRTIAISGSKAYLKNTKDTPTIGIIGELDAVRCPDHPESEPTTGAAESNLTPMKPRWRSRPAFKRGKRC